MHKVPSMFRNGVRLTFKRHLIAHTIRQPFCTAALVNDNNKHICMYVCFECVHTLTQVRAQTKLRCDKMIKGPYIKRWQLSYQIFSTIWNEVQPRRNATTVVLLTASVGLWTLFGIFGYWCMFVYVCLIILRYDRSSRVFWVRTSH